MNKQKTHQKQYFQGFQGFSQKKNSPYHLKIIVDKACNNWYYLARHPMSNSVDERRI